MGWLYGFDRSKESLIEEIKFQNEVIDSAICRGDGKECQWSLKSAPLWAPKSAPL